jgi:hypothetical protein
MNQGQAALLTEVGVGVDSGRFAVSRPPRVADPQIHRGIVSIDAGFQLGELSLLFDEKKMGSAAIKAGNSGGVVSAVFEAFESLNQNGHGFSGAHVTDDAAHKVLS